MTNRELVREKIAEIVGQAVGEGSMCWHRQPHGEFDSTHASKVTDNAANKILALFPKVMSYDEMYDIALGCCEVDGNIKNLLEALSSKLPKEEKPRCEVCGGTDMVCGKGWLKDKEAKDKIIARDRIELQDKELEIASKDKEIDRLRGVLGLLNAMACQRFAWERNSNEDNEGWLKVSDVITEALKGTHE